MVRALGIRMSLVTGALGLFACTGEPEVVEAPLCPLEVTREFTNVSVAQPELPDTTGPCLVLDDLDGDGTLELVTNTFLVASESRLDLFRQEGGEFKLVRSLLDGGGNPIACTAADYDNDGRLDIYAIAREVHVPHLFHNDGGLAFSEPAGALPPLEVEDLAYFGHGFFDYDNDGFVDLMIGRYVGVPNLQPAACVATKSDIYCPPLTEMARAEPLMFHNLGGKRFELLASGAFPAPWATMTHTLSPVDWDGDGFLDVFLANDFGPDQLYLNEAGSGAFVDRADELGFGGPNHGMGAAIGDFDLDGHRDLFVADLGPGRLFMGDGGGHVVNRALERGVAQATRYTSSWAPIAADLDHDGDEDLLVVTSFVGTNDGDVMRTAAGGETLDVIDQHDILLWNEGAKFTAAELPHRLKTHRSVMYGASAAGDIDGDGDLDLAAMSSHIAEFRLMRNDLSGGNWLAVELSSSPTQTATGSRVTLFREGAAIATREYHNSLGSVGVSQRALHFGLCDVEAIDALEVRWPTGAVERVEGPIATNQRLELTAPNR